MTILGIDPGIATAGFGVIEKTNDTFQLIAYGTIATKKTEALDARLARLFGGITSLIKKHKPKRIAVEELFFAKNAKTAITVAHARGVIMLAAHAAGCVVEEYTPLEVKQALTGYGRADKNQVQHMVKTTLSLKTIPKPDDAADALAVAICAGQQAAWTLLGGLDASGQSGSAPKEGRSRSLALKKDGILRSTRNDNAYGQ